MPPPSPPAAQVEDIPALVADAAAAFPEVPYAITPPLGANPLVGALVEAAVSETLRLCPPGGGSGGDDDDMGFFGDIMRQMQASVEADGGREGGGSSGGQEEEQQPLRPLTIEELVGMPPPGEGP